MPKRNRTRPNVFVSYSHKDERWKDLLLAHLEVFQKPGLLSVWDDRQIGAGKEWCQAIQEAVEAASVAVLLVSAHFLTSRFILSEEVPRLLQRRDEGRLRIVPVIVTPCDWEAVDWLRPMQARPKDGRPLSRGRQHQINNDLALIAKEVRLLLGHPPAHAPGQQDVPPPEPECVPVGTGSVLTATGAASIEIVINRDFNSYSDEEKDKLLAAIREFLGVTGDIRVLSKRKGSVKLTLQLTPEQAERLQWAIKAGEFAVLGVVDANLIDSVPPESTPVSPPCERVSEAPHVLDAGTRPRSASHQKRSGTPIQQLVEEHYVSLYRYAHRLTGSAADAEDLTQEAFCKAQTHFGQLRDPDRVRPWLFSILRNAYLHRVRSDRRDHHMSLDDVGDLTESLPRTLPPEGPERLQETLNDLPESLRTPVILYYFEEFSYRDIAEQMDVPIGTLMSRLARAKAHLRARLVRQDAESIPLLFRDLL